MRQEAASTYPVRHRGIDEETPQHQEDEIAFETHAVGKGASNESRCDDGEHFLKYEIRHQGDALGGSWNQQCGSSHVLQAEVLTGISNETRDILPIHQTETAQDPDNRTTHH